MLRKKKRSLCYRRCTQNFRENLVYCLILKQDAIRASYFLFLLPSVLSWFECFIDIVLPTFKEHKRTNKHDDDHHIQSTKQIRRRHRRAQQHEQSSVSLNNYRDSLLSCPDDILFKNSKEYYQKDQTSSNECVVNSDQLTKSTKSSFHHPTDSDGESERMPVKPWSPTPDLNGSSSSPLANNNNNTNENEQPIQSPQIAMAIRGLFEMITEDLDKFVYTPAPNGLGDIQCRITRDKRGMEKGLFPTYYMHVERPGDGKKVSRENRQSSSAF